MNSLSTVTKYTPPCCRAKYVSDSYKYMNDRHSNRLESGKVRRAYSLVSIALSQLCDLHLLPTTHYTYNEAQTEAQQCHYKQLV